VPTLACWWKVVFFIPRVLCLLIFSRKLKQEEWISFLNEQIKLELPLIGSHDVLKLNARISTSTPHAFLRRVLNTTLRCTFYQWRCSDKR
jgi:hypothetical protein